MTTRTWFYHVPYSFTPGDEIVTPPEGLRLENCRNSTGRSIPIFFESKDLTVVTDPNAAIPKWRYANHYILSDPLKGNSDLAWVTEYVVLFGKLFSGQICRDYDLTDIYNEPEDHNLMMFRSVAGNSYQWQELCIFRNKAADFWGITGAGRDPDILEGEFDGDQSTLDQLAKLEYLEGVEGAIWFIENWVTYDKEAVLNTIQEFRRFADERFTPGRWI